MDESKAKMSKISKDIRNVHKISNLVNFSGTKTLVCPNPKNKP
jgi:pantothenate kinase